MKLETTAEKVRGNKPAIQQEIFDDIKNLKEGLITEAQDLIKMIEGDQIDPERLQEHIRSMISQMGSARELKTVFSEEDILEIMNTKMKLYEAADRYQKRHQNDKLEEVVSEDYDHPMLDYIEETKTAIAKGTLDADQIFERQRVMQEFIQSSFASRNSLDDLIRMEMMKRWHQAIYLTIYADCHGEKKAFEHRKEAEAMSMNYAA